MSARIERLPTPEELGQQVAGQLITAISESAPGRPFHLCLTGGTMGSQVLAQLALRPEAAELPWERVHLWWSDERFLPEGDPQRNVTQNRQALGDLPIRWDQAHPMAAAAPGVDAETGAQRYADELREHGLTAGTWDLVLLGVGPDGHIASLFPGRELPTGLTAAVLDSPKPPPQRITVTLPLLGGAQRVWLVVAGADKAAAVAASVPGGSGELAGQALPAAAVAGQQETIWWLDEAAAAELTR